MRVETRSRRYYVCVADLPLWSPLKGNSPNRGNVGKADKRVPVRGTKDVRKDRGVSSHISSLYIFRRSSRAVGKGLLTYKMYRDVTVYEGGASLANAAKPHLLRFAKQSEGQNAECSVQGSPRPRKLVLRSNPLQPRHINRRT